jgi:hypothetical protein
MALTIERSFDYELLTKIITHPAIYEWLVGDGAPDAYVIPRGDWPWYVVVKDGNELLGMFILVPWNAVCWEAHACLLPNAWGERARHACREGIEWLWKNSPCRKLMGNICRDNRLALAFARRVGARIIGVNEDSIFKHGALRDQIIVGFGPPNSGNQPHPLETSGPASK